MDLQLIQILNHSQYIVGGDKEVKYTNELKDDYEIYINHLKEEIQGLKNTIQSLPKRGHRELSLNILEFKTVTILTFKVNYEDRQFLLSIRKCRINADLDCTYMIIHF